MLQGISPVISPDLLYVMASMGHGDFIVIADAHFPGHSVNETTLRADGVSVLQLLEGILPLFPLDTFCESSVTMMAPVPGDICDPEVERSYRRIIKDYQPAGITIEFCKRFDFYERAKEAFAVVVSGDTAKYGNIILTKGLVSG